MRKTLLSFTAAILTVISFCGCSAENARQTSTVSEAPEITSAPTEKPTEKEENYEDEVFDILNGTSFMSGITYGQLLAGMFEDPQFEINATKIVSTGEVTGYTVTASGSYRSSIDTYYINQGSAYITINLVNGTCELTGDHDFKSAATYFALDITGYY